MNTVRGSSNKQLYLKKRSMKTNILHNQFSLPCGTGLAYRTSISVGAWDKHKVYSVLEV